jgi:integrase/recombinase XerC
MGRVYKPTYCRRVPAGAEIVERDGKRFARIRAGHPGARPILAPLTKAGDRCIVAQSNYWGVYTDADGRTARVPLFTDLGVSRIRLAEIEKRVERIRGGIEAPHERHLARPAAELIEEFRGNLEDKARTDGYVGDAIAYVKRTVEACGFRTLNDVDPVRVEQYLADRRDGGLSHGGHNSYVRALKAFGNWLVKKRGFPRSPFATLGRLNPKVDRRRVRRAARLEELARLIAAAEARPPFRGLHGRDRAMLYRVAAETGFRASELASVTVRSLDLAAEPPTITVRAAYSKHRDNDVQPVPHSLATRLRAWLDSRGEAGPFLPFEELDEFGDRRLWPGTWHTRAAEMLREDLQAARELWIKEGKGREEKHGRRGDRDFLQYVDSGGQVIDFHSLRGTLATNLAKAGVHPKAAQQLMRHSDINLTMTTYTNLRAVDVAAELNRLPTIEIAESELAATGTDAGAGGRGRDRRGAASSSASAQDQSGSRAGASRSEAPEPSGHGDRWATRRSGADYAAKQCGADAGSLATCNETCKPTLRDQQQKQQNTAAKNGAAGTRTQNQRIMSPLL